MWQLSVERRGNRPAIINQAEAYAAAQDKMRESAEGNEMLIREARDRAEMLLFQYVEGVGKKLGVEYEIRVKDAE